MNKLLMGLLGMMLAGAAGAKLPAPGPEAQAKADEAKQKAAWSDKAAAYQLCQAQDRVAAGYRKARGAEARPEAAPAIPPCQDPGPYVSAAAAAKVGVADSLPVPAAGKPSPSVEANK